ncbi:MAG TPA: potassium channel family protein [Alphaproteobacteria bacterium]|nr:potassium channel family protein [Alphaproteobacteria bacterium]
MSKKIKPKKEKDHKSSIIESNHEIKDVFSSSALSNHLSSTDESIKRQSFFGNLFSWTMKHFFITFILLYLATTLSIVSENTILSILIGATLIAFITIYLSKTIKENIYKFMHNQLGIKQILVGYVSTILAFIGLFAIIYWGVSTWGVGYLKYGSCSAAAVTSEMIANDPGLVTDGLNYVYFSAMTFLTVGYGDICAMGAAIKITAIIESLVGNVFTLLILAIAISNYNSKKNNGNSENNEIKK